LVERGIIENGAFGKYRGINRDITDHHRFEDEFRIFKAVVENSVGAVNVTSFEGKTVYDTPVSFAHCDFSHKQIKSFLEIHVYDKTILLIPHPHAILASIAP
jgi:hypothetical protein